MSQTKFLAYIGLEMAMSIAQFNTVEEYWKRDMFLGHTDFQRVMSRDDFQNIRLHMKFVPPSMSNVLRRMKVQGTTIVPEEIRLVQ